MRRFYLIMSVAVVFLSTGWIFSQNGKTKDITIHDFMEDYVELAEKKFKKGDKEPLRKLLQTIPDLALAEDKEKWQEITNEAIDSGKYLSSCKSCHSKFKKSYKKSYRKRMVSVPEEVLNFK